MTGLSKRTASTADLAAAIVGSALTAAGLSTSASQPSAMAPATAPEGADAAPSEREESTPASPSVSASASAAAPAAAVGWAEPGPVSIVMPEALTSSTTTAPLVAKTPPASPSATPTAGPMPSNLKLSPRERRKSKERNSKDKERLSSSGLVLKKQSSSGSLSPRGHTRSNSGKGHFRTGSGSKKEIIPVEGLESGPPSANAGRVIPYPVCPPAADGSGNAAMSVRQKCLAPELVAVWEADMNFTEEQQKLMQDFRAALLAEGLLHEFLDHKTSFFRWLQARKWSLPDAVLMVRNHLEWRKLWKLDEWVPTPNGPIPRLLHEFVLPELDSVKRGYKFAHHKTTTDGMPVYFDRLGCIDFKGMISESSPERVLEYFVWYSEATQQWRMPAASIEYGRYHGKGLYVMDMKGFGMGVLNKDTRAFLAASIKIASDNYPETIKMTWIVNAPFVFRAAWAMVCKMLDENTVRKFSILGGKSEYMPKLLAVMDKKDIPDFLGGEDTTCQFNVEVGPGVKHFPTTRGPWLSEKDRQA